MSIRAPSPWCRSPGCLGQVRITTLLGPLWAIMPILAAWLAWRGSPGLAALAISPYWTPAYPMLLVLELGRHLGRTEASEVGGLAQDVVIGERVVEHGRLLPGGGIRVVVVGRAGVDTSHRGEGDPERVSIVHDDRARIDADPSR